MGLSIARRSISSVAGGTREFNGRKNAGLTVQYLTRKELRFNNLSPAVSAILSEQDGQVDPFRLTQSLLEVAVRRGLWAFSQTCVHGVEDHDDGVTLFVSGRRRIRCHHVIVATGYEALKFPSLPSTNLQSTYVAVGQLLPNDESWREQLLIWETARRTSTPVDWTIGGAMIGGEDTAFHDDHKRAAGVQRAAHRLVRRFHQLFPSLQFRVEQVWAGTFAETAHGLPFIGRLPGRARIYVALGYGGNGITFAVIAANLIADLIAGRSSDEETVFAVRANRL